MALSASVSLSILALLCFIFFCCYSSLSYVLGILLYLGLYIAHFGAPLALLQLPPIKCVCRRSWRRARVSVTSSPISASSLRSVKVWVARDAIRCGWRPPRRVPYAKTRSFLAALVLIDAGYLFGLNNCICRMLKYKFSIIQETASYVIYKHCYYYIVCLLHYYCDLL